MWRLAAIARPALGLLRVRSSFVLAAVRALGRLARADLELQASKHAISMPARAGHQLAPQSLASRAYSTATTAHVHGAEAPRAPVKEGTSVAELRLAPRLTSNLLDMGVATLTGVQAAVIPVALDGGDALAKSHTGRARASRGSSSSLLAQAPARRWRT